MRNAGGQHAGTQPPLLMLPPPLQAQAANAPPRQTMAANMEIQAHFRVVRPGAAAGWLAASLHWCQGLLPLQLALLAEGSHWHPGIG